MATAEVEAVAAGSASEMSPAVDPAATLRDLLDRLRAAPRNSPPLPNASIDAALSLCFEVQAHLHKLQLAGASCPCGSDCGICTSGSDSESSSSASTTTKGNRPSARGRARLRRAQQAQMHEQQQLQQPPPPMSPVSPQQHLGGTAPMQQWQEWQWQWRDPVMDPMQSAVPFSHEQVAAMEQQFRSSLWSGGWHMAPMVIAATTQPQPPLQPQPPPVQSVYVSEQHQQSNFMQQMWTGGWHMIPSGEQSMSTVREEGEHAPSEEPTGKQDGEEEEEGAVAPTDSEC